jgi:ribose transport system substrate-binding protein
MTNVGSLTNRPPRRRARLLAFTAASAVVVVCAACSSGGSSSTAASGSSPTAGSGGSATAGSGSASSSGKKLTFVDVPGVTTDAFYITLHNGAFAYAAGLGINLKYQGTAQSGAAPSVQVGIVQALLSTKPDALIISPSNVTALIAPIQQFVNAKIPVVAVDTTISNAALLVTQITSDNTQGGQLAADTIAKEHGGKGEVAVENVPPGVSTTDARLAGFEQELKKYPGMKMVGVENDNGEASLAQAQAKSLILSHPGLVGIFGTNLDGGEGAGDAVVASGDKGKITVVAYDAEPAEVQLLKQGVVSALIIQQPALEGRDAVQYAEDYIDGKKSDIPKSVLVPNVVATTQNMNDADISKYFYSASVSQ